MFNVEFLHSIREYEFERIVPFFPPGARILEIGGGTGYQAKRLNEAGFVVSSIDIAASNYSEVKEFPVQEYDGSRFPFPENSFDIVFSSNVLEHIIDLSRTHNETRRVLRGGGYCIHVMPTGTWRFWTNIAHYVELVQRLIKESWAMLPRRIDRTELRRLRVVVGGVIKTAKHFAVVPRHGELGNAVTEIFTFSRRHWKKHFLSQNFEVIKVEPLGLFYTGHMILGKRLPVSIRKVAARFLGSACVLYKVRPKEDRELLVDTAWGGRASAEDGELQNTLPKVLGQQFAPESALSREDSLADTEWP